MPDFNIDDLSAKFGGGDGASSAPAPMFNVDDLASKFGGNVAVAKTEDKTPAGLKKVYIVKPPISDLPKDQSDAINAEPGIQGGANPRDTALAEGIRNYVPAIAGAIGNNAVEGVKTASSGLGDIVNQGDLAGGAKKIGLGGLQALTSIPAGIVSEGIEKPIANITGSSDIADRAGLIAGSAIPVVPGAGTISKLRPSNTALRDLVGNITNEGANPENLVPVVQAMKANPRIGPADVNPAVLSATQKLFAVEGDKTKNYLAKTSADRMASAPNAVKEAYDQHTGLPVDAVQKLKDLSDAAKKVGNEQINPAIAGAKPVDISGTLAHIDKTLKPGVNSVVSSGSTLPLPEIKGALSNFRKMLANPNEMRTGAEDIHGLQSALRVHAERLLGSASGSDRSLGHALMDVRNHLVSDIDDASGGKYKPALANYRDEKHIAEAFNDAYSGVFSNSKKIENRPEFTKQWLDGLSPHELEAAKQGARLAIDTEIRSARNPALAGTNMVKSDFNQQKLEMLFGKEEAGNLIKKLQDERAIANTHNKIVENSQTAMRIAADSKRDLPKPAAKGNIFERLAPYAAPVAAEAANYYGTGYAIPGIGLAATVAANGLTKGGAVAKDAVKLALAKETNAKYAKLALPTQGPERDQLIKSLEAAIPGPKQSLVRRGAGTLAGLVSP